jgi:hypothetical protein
MKNIAHTIDGHPATGSLNINVLIAIKHVITIDMRKNINPTKEDINNGTVQKATIPSTDLFINISFI